MEYKLQTKLKKDECLQRLNDYVQRGTLGNVLRTNILEDNEMFIGKVNDDTFWIRFSPPYSLSRAVPFSRRFHLVKTFKGKILSNENGSMIVGRNTLNSTTYIQIFSWAVLILICVYISIYDHYFPVLIAFGYLFFYILSKFTQPQRINNNLPYNKNISFLKRLLEAEEV